jgi:hypothetical protein
MERVMLTAKELPASTFAFDRPTGALSEDALAHRRRCKGLPPVKPGEVERLVAGFLATRGVTACPTRYAAPIEQRSQSVRSAY